MTLRIRNSWTYKGQDWWDWAAFLDDEGSGDIAKVDHVKYVLHETFEDPIRRADDAQKGFRLETEGWGEFELKAHVHFKDGRKRTLRHMIKLGHEPKGMSK
jgi:transcription initiation factor IIF auxiliary subunit